MSLDRSLARTGPAGPDGLPGPLWPGYTSGSWYGPSAVQTPAAASSAVADGFGGLAPVYISKTISIDRLGLWLVTASATGGAVARLGIYTNEVGRPGQVVVDGGTVAVDSGGGTLKTVTLAGVTLSPNWYWLAAVKQGGGNDATSSSVISTVMPGPPGELDVSVAATSVAQLSGWQISVSGALVNYPTLTAINTAAVPVILFRVA